jgi:predicted nuclease with TOPRIM domain
LPEVSKQDLLLKDIAIVLSQVTILSNKYKDLSQQNSELESEVNELKKEKAGLIQKLSMLETEIENIKKQNHTEIFNSLDEEEREDLKSKITNLISKIDLHISS